MKRSPIPLAAQLRLERTASLRPAAAPLARWFREVENEMLGKFVECIRRVPRQLVKGGR